MAKNIFLEILYFKRKKKMGRSRYKERRGRREREYDNYDNLIQYRDSLSTFF